MNRISVLPKSRHTFCNFFTFEKLRNYKLIPPRFKLPKVTSNGGFESEEKIDEEEEEESEEGEEIGATLGIQSLNCVRIFPILREIIFAFLPLTFMYSRYVKDYSGP